MAWLDINFLYRMKVTVDKDQVSGASHTNYPIYLDLSDLGATFFSHVQNGGGDIRVTLVNGTTEVPREIVFCDTGTEKGEIHFKPSSLSGSVDSDYYIYYGNAGASDYAVDATYGAENVWDDYYKFVGHLHNSFLDSTSNDNDATDGGSDDIAGKMGQGRDCIAANDDHIQIDALANAFKDYTALTVSFWFNPDIDTDHKSLFSNAGANDGAPYIKFDVHATKAVYIEIADDSPATARIIAVTDNNVFVLGAWSLLQYTGTATSNKTYIDGLLETMNYSTGNAATAGTPAAWGMPTGTRLSWGALRRGAVVKNEVDALFDELRISNIERDADWNLTERTNQNTPGTFFKTFGGEEDAPTPVSADRGIPEMAFEEIVSDREIHISGASLYSPITSDYTLPLYALMHLAEDRNLHVETGGMVRVDRTIPIWSGIDFYSYTMCVDALGGTPADRVIPVDAGLHIKPDKSITVDAMGPTIGDRTIPIGVLAYLEKDVATPVDILMGIRMDETTPFWAYHDPAENRVLGLSVFEHIRQDREIPMATLLRVNKPVTIPVAVMSNLYQDIDILINVLMGIRGERTLHAEASGMLAVDNRIMPIDFLTGLKQDARVPVDMRGWAAASFSIPIGVAQVIQKNIEIIAEANQGLGPNKTLPVDAVGQTSNDITLLINSLMGLAPDKELITDATGYVSADRELITEWLKGVSLDKEFRVDPLEGIVSDAEINLSILQGQAESAVAADRALSLAIIQELKEDAILPVDALQKLEADVTALLDAMTTLIADRAIPIDAKYGGVVILSRKIRSLLITEGVFSSLWRRGD